MSKMSEKNLAKVLAKKASMTDESKNRMLKAGGSVTTNYTVDAQAICREVRHGYMEDDYVHDPKESLKQALIEVKLIKEGKKKAKSWKQLKKELKNIKVDE